MSLIVKDVQKAIDGLKELGGNVGSLSDGYHTFDELYHHRAVLFSMICHQNKELAWKSLQHFNPDDEMFEGMFIVGIDTPYGQVTYHYDLPYWDLFKVKELERAQKWDNSTPMDCINRLLRWSQEI